MAHAHFTLDSWGYKHTFWICNSFCFSTATVVARKCLNVTLNGHFLSCFFFKKVEITLNISTTSWRRVGEWTSIFTHSWPRSYRKLSVSIMFRSHYLPLHHMAESSCAPLSAMYSLVNRKPSCLCWLTDSSSSVVHKKRRLVPPLTTIFGCCPSVHHPYRLVIKKFTSSQEMVLFKGLLNQSLSWGSLGRTYGKGNVLPITGHKGPEKE
jgi:hypothetical protein